MASNLNLEVGRIWFGGCVMPLIPHNRCAAQRNIGPKFKTGQNMEVEIGNG